MARHEGEQLIGPGQPCICCGEGYGQHTKDCPVPHDQKQTQDRADRALAKRFREALAGDDDLILGRILREIAENI